ncbi:MAG: 3,4-dihydroxy-2-butanone-4-phosphate synthase [Ottowia sp.]
MSAADRAHRAGRRAPTAQAADLVKPGHIFPLQAVEGGVLMRAGHRPSWVRLVAMAGAARLPP